MIRVVFSELPPFDQARTCEVFNCQLHSGAMNEEKKENFERFPVITFG